MSIPELRWYESDGMTPLGLLDLGDIGPGESRSGQYGAPLDVVLKNAGEASVDVEVRITQIADYPTHTHLSIAEGATEPAAGAFQAAATPLDIGTLAPGATARIWVEAEVPPTATRGEERMANLRAVAVEPEGS